MARLVIALEERVRALEAVNARALADAHLARQEAYERTPLARQERECIEILRARRIAEAIAARQRRNSEHHAPSPPSEH